MLLEERLTGLFEYLDSNYVAEAARWVLLIVPTSGLGDRWCLGALKMPV